MSSHIDTGVTQLWPAQQESLARTSMSGTKPPFLPEEQWSHLWGRSSAGLSALGRNHGEERGRGTYLSGHSCVEGKKEWQVTGTCCPSVPLCFPVAVAFHSTGPEVPAPLLWLVSNVLYLIDFKHSEMSHADFLWERTRTSTCFCHVVRRKLNVWARNCCWNTKRRNLCFLQWELTVVIIAFCTKIDKPGNFPSSAYPWNCL